MSSSQVTTGDMILRLVIAILLSSVVGAEREAHNKDAGLRTNALVGLGAALIMLTSQFGFFNVISQGRIVLDPSRVAAQVVSGVGFIGGGLIFIRQEAVKGLTTAASVWLAAALGLAAGAGLWLVATAATAAYLLVVFTYRWLEQSWLGHKPAGLDTVITVCRDQPGVLAGVTTRLAEEGADIQGVTLARTDDEPDLVTLNVRLRSIGEAVKLATAVLDVPGVVRSDGRN